MKYCIILSLTALLFSCSNAPFINHKLQAEKINVCTDKLSPSNIRMNMNVIGERYEFECCLEEGFDVKNYTIERTVDSVFVKFPSIEGKVTAFYKIVLDIDAKPSYSYISINGTGINLKRKK